MNRVPSPRRLRLGATVLGVTLVLVGSATAATIHAAGEPARRDSAGKMRPVDFAAYTRHGQARALVDSLVEPIVSNRALDSIGLVQLVAATRSSSGDEHWIAAADSASRSDTSTWPLLRRVARAEPLPPMWGYREVGDRDKWWSLSPMRASRPVRDFARDNESFADSALLRGDTHDALTRARENIALARHYLDQPQPLDFGFGQYLVVQSSKLLARAALQAGDHFTASQAKRLLELTTAMRATNPFATMWADAGDPSATVLLALARHDGVAPALRLYTLLAAVEGACANSREVAMGSTAARRALVDSIAAAVSHLDWGGQRVTLSERLLEVFDRAEYDEVAALAPSRGAFTPAVWTEQVAPSAVQSRIAMCRMM